MGQAVGMAQEDVVNPRGEGGGCASPNHRCSDGARRRPPPQQHTTSRNHPSRLGVPRMWVVGGSMTSSKFWVNIAAAKNATARSV
jgi:hypothetical protein